MVKRESAPKERTFRLLLGATVTGLAVALAALMCLAMLMENGLVGAGEWGLFSRLALAVAALSAAMYARLRTVRDRLALSCAAGAIALLFLVPLSLLCGEMGFSAAAVGIDMAVILCACFCVCVVAPKGRGHRKIRKVHK